MKTSIVARNAVVAIGQVVVTSAVLFVLYRYLLITVGVERLGIWTVVMAAASSLRIGEMGLSGSATRYVAKYYALDQPGEAAKVVQTAVLSLAVIGALFLSILYPLLHWLFVHFFPAGSLAEARALLPFSLIYLWLITVGGVLQSGLDGCLRTDLRGLLVVGGNFLLLALALVMVPRFGLVGLVYAQIFQAVSLTVSGWMFLRYAIKELPIVPFRWNCTSFREIFGYSANLQLINVCVMLFEPVTKMFLAKFGDLSMAGYYELAQRLVSQIRAVLLAANQILVPVIAHLHETDPARIQSLYKDDYRMLFYLALPIHMGIAGLSPVISELWIGQYTEIFVVFLVVLVCAACVHILTGPAYFMNLGTGYLRWNVAGHIGMSVGNLVLAFLLGSYFGGMGVVAASAIALMGGGMTVLIPYHLKYRQPLRELLPRESSVMLLSCISGMLVAMGIYYAMGSVQGTWVRLVTVCLLLVAFFLPAMWFHPQRVAVASLIRKGVAG